MPTAVEAPPIGDLIHIPISKIIENPNNIRNGSSDGFDDKSLAELADSIYAVGLIEPLIVYGGDDGTYQLLAGARRRRAIALLVDSKRWKKTQTVPCLTRGARVDDGEQTMLALIENLQRVDISPFDEARGYRRMIDEFGYTQRELAEKVGKASGQITKRLALLTIDPRFEAFVTKGTVTLEVAYEISQLDDKQQKALLKKLTDQPGTSAQSFEYSVDMQTRTKKDKAAAKAFTTALEKALIETVDKVPEPRNDWVSIGSYDKSTLDNYTPKRGHVVVRSTTSYDANRITVYRKRTKADAAKQEKVNEDWAEQRREREAERVEHLDPHQRWSYAEREKLDEYHAAMREHGERIDAAVGSYISELAPKDAGKLAMAIVATQGFNSPKTSATRLGVVPVTTDDQGNDLNQWDFDYEGPLREWVGTDTAKLVKCWIAGEVKVSTINELGEFQPFRDLLAEQGVIAPERPVAEPEPWLNTETGEWSTEPHPEGETESGESFEEELEDIELSVDDDFGD